MSSADNMSLGKWEYQWIRVRIYGEDREVGQYDLDRLDELGSKGWEAYAISEYAHDSIFHLKRFSPPEIKIVTDFRGKDPKEHGGDDDCA